MRVKKIIGLLFLLVEVAHAQTCSDLHQETRDYASKMANLKLCFKEKSIYEKIKLPPSPNYLLGSSIFGLTRILGLVAMNYQIVRFGQRSEKVFQLKGSWTRTLDALSVPTQLNEATWCSRPDWTSKLTAYNEELRILIENSENLLRASSTEELCQNFLKEKHLQSQELYFKTWPKERKAQTETH